MSTLRDPLNRTLLIVFASLTSLAMLVGLMGALIGVRHWATRIMPDGGVAVRSRFDAAPVAGGSSGVAAGAVIGPAAGKRFTLRLGQGFRFKDGAVLGKQEEGADLVFKYLPPQVGGMALRYNPISQQVEQGMEPTLTSPVPLIVSTHISAFEAKPDVGRITSGDVAGYFNQAPINAKTRYLLMMSGAGDPYLLTLDELEAVPGKYDDWRIGFAYERVQLPLGLAGGKINKPLPGRLIFRDWYRSKMIVRVDLTTGKEEAIADGTLPSVGGDGLLGYGDSTSAYVVRDSAGKTQSTIRFNEQVMGPVLSPDGARVLATVYRPGPATQLGGMTFPGVATLSVAVFDRAGREVASTVGYDDATWAPDGKLIATGKLYDPGLFEIDPATKNVRAIDARIGSPFQPCVSPDGRTIAFVTNNKVWLIDRDGKNLRQLFPDGHNQQRPAFSPDGTKVAIITCNQLGVDASGEVFVIDPKTQEITPVRTSTGASLVPDPSTRLNWVP